MMNLSKILVNGNLLAKQYVKHTKQAILEEQTQYSSFYQLHPQYFTPKLHIINIGFDDASLSYIHKKIDIATSIGINFELHQFT